MNQEEMRNGRWVQNNYRNNHRSNNIPVGRPANNTKYWYDSRQFHDHRYWRGTSKNRVKRKRVLYPRPGLSSRGRVENVESSDEEVKIEKRKTANIIQNKLLSLSDEYKSNSMKQLIQDPTEDQDSSSIAKPNESEKQARRIAHTPKVIRLSDQPPTESAVSEPIDCNLQRDANKISVRKRSTDKVMSSLMQDLMSKSPEELKRMATSPNTNENQIFLRLTAFHRSQMSEAMRKLAEHKLQLENGSSPQLLAELEQLVQPDMAIDMYNMPLETVQCLQEIFNLNFDGDLCDPEMNLNPIPVPNGCTNNQPLNGSGFVQLPVSNGDSLSISNSSVSYAHCPYPPNYGLPFQVSNNTFPTSMDNNNTFPTSMDNNNTFPTSMDDNPVIILDSKVVEKKANGVLKSSDPRKKRKKHKRIQTNEAEEIQVIKNINNGFGGFHDEQSWHLMADFENFLLTINSPACMQGSQILRSTAVKCVSALIQNFTKQFMELHPSPRIPDESDSFLDPHGTIKRIRIPGPCPPVPKPPEAQKEVSKTTPISNNQESLQMKKCFVNCTKMSSDNLQALLTSRVPVKIVKSPKKT